MTICAFKQNKSDASFLTLDDALPETIISTPTARANLSCFTGDKVRKHDVCPQGTCEIWRGLQCLIKETAAYYLICYYIGMLANIRYDNMIILCITNKNTAHL